MNTMYRCALIAVAAISIAAPAAAQVERNFPPLTLRATMVFGNYPQVTLNGQATQLSPGSRVRNADNRIVQGGSLTGMRFIVNYTLDGGGTQLQDVWILRASEAAISPWPTTLDQARTWTYDSTAKTWTKP
jgi:hypothetical protein